MAHERLRNPERYWDAPSGARSADSIEVELRTGLTSNPPQALSGGLRNTNVLVDGRVLRIYRENPGVAQLEAALLRRAWTSFRVPALIGAGSDFTLLEYVEHGPLLGSTEHGTAVGRALAEIHRLSFDQCGFLDAKLTVATPFVDLIAALIEYARREITSSAAAVNASLTERLLQTLSDQTAAMAEVAGPPVLLHGDFKVSNLHWASEQRLLVLDWEFAYAGSCLSDIGQLLRWQPCAEFVAAFALGYTDSGQALPADFEQCAALFDLVSLAGLLATPVGVGASSSRLVDVAARIEDTLARFR